eukprot:Gregarina_sp_Poly_1__3358@NODE_196_length_11576_cov_92_095925_g175_i0_p16_GENE_NODE_196_length_11576_cov_92_095925_g175_i0NODE_196_length_11576_cov_92_095925_g175_i0_p16_ORF_typecomplete_len109_score6_14DASH_Ask1/PF08655_10/3_2e03DASH_Ask1/PF08655_10/0_27_NODE_196_length_11576_cov_92_095925_g175_i037314057
MAHVLTAHANKSSHCWANSWQVFKDVSSSGEAERMRTNLANSTVINWRCNSTFFRRRTEQPVATPLVQALKLLSDIDAKFSDRLKQLPWRIFNIVERYSSFCSTAIGV